MCKLKPFNAEAQYLYALLCFASLALLYNFKFLGDNSFGTWVWTRQKIFTFFISGFYSVFFLPVIDMYNLF